MIIFRTEDDVQRFAEGRTVTTVVYDDSIRPTYTRILDREANISEFETYEFESVE
jgi:hypothetical protein